MSGARVWLVTGLSNVPAPTDQPTVRNDQMRTWRPGPHCRSRTGEGRHHATWDELHARHDLVEVTEARMAEATLAGTP
ncbi:MAG: hypothetical protein JO364_13160 [Pseudonocardiales bacterium]|nr:hypothetical protein [Pseudonocardiales bacterium]MBV9031221.1 hypothetical protein [Pseudonocardiales bacterium]